MTKVYNFCHQLFQMYIFQQFRGFIFFFFKCFLNLKLCNIKSKSYIFFNFAKQKNFFYKKQVQKWFRINKKVKLKFVYMKNINKLNKLLFQIKQIKIKKCNINR